MAESLGDIKITASTDAEAKALIGMLRGQGATQITKMLSSAGQAMVSAKVPTANLPTIQAAIPKKSRWMTKTDETAPTAALSLAQRLQGAFTQQNMYRMNKSLFMMQMASLGVVFSFQSVINSAMGLFSGLEDLGANIAGGAIGTAFAGIATGGANTTNIAETMGVTPEMATAAWAGFTAIINQFKAVIDSLMVKVLSPEMVGAILAVIDALAGELGKPEVTKAVQELVKAVLDLALAVIPLIPVIASVINWLGDTGLLGLFISIIFAAQILLPLLAYFQFIFQAILMLVNVLAFLGIGLATFFFWVGVILIAIDFLIHLFENLSNGMDPLDAVLTALGQTVADVVNIIIGAINPILGFLGMAKIEKWSTSSGHEPATTTQAKTVVNNITFAKSVNTGDKKAAATMGTQVANATYG